MMVRIILRTITERTMIMRDTMMVMMMMDPISFLLITTITHILIRKMILI